MKVVLAGNFSVDELERWETSLRAAVPEAIWLSPDAARADAGSVEAAVVANPPAGSLAGLPALRLIQSLWAGVEGLLADRTLPAGVPLARMVDPAMNGAMAETALWAVLALHRGYFDYQRQQRDLQWAQHEQRRADEVPVLVLGFGQMGRAVAVALQWQGYPVRAWRAQSAGADEASIPVTSGRAALHDELRRCDVVVNLLPLTPRTRGLLDAAFFARMPRGSAVINFARGAHLVDDDLLAALDSGHLRHAVLDVFHAEPLPREHRFWTHRRVTMLPHAAALTDPRSAAAVVAVNLRALRDGAPIHHLVDRGRGY